MDRIVKRILPTLSLTLLSAFVAVPFAAQADEGEGVVERVVVRNRKYSVQNRIEASPMVGLSMTNRMTEQYNFQLGIAYNFSETLALELRPGFAMGGLTSIGKQARTDIPPVDADPHPRSEFQDLWRLEWSALVMPRWTPIYGKINLATELPIHFQAYLTAGAGVVGLTYDSIVYCQAGCSGDDSFISEQRQSFAIAGGAGLRIFLSELLSLRLEIYDLAYPDEYRVDIRRVEARKEASGPPQEGDVTSAGLSNVLFFNAGISATF